MNEKFLKSTELWLTYRKTALYMAMWYVYLFIVIFNTHKNSFVLQISVFISYGLFGLITHMSVKSLNEIFERTKYEAINEVNQMTKMVELLRELMNHDGHEKTQKMMKDSLLANIEILRTVAKNQQSPCAARTEVVDNEFESILIVRRKSLPIDETLYALHKGNII